MLSRGGDNGKRTALHILVHTLILVPVSTGLFIIGTYGKLYLAITMLNGLAFVYMAVLYSKTPDKVNARRVFLYSIIYLPLLFLAIILDKVF